MEEAKTIRTLVLDTNVLISSLVKSEGITRHSHTILLPDQNCKVQAPAEVIQELRKYADEICDKASITKSLFEETLDRLLENIHLVPAPLYEYKLHRALRLVRDEDDAPFAALALTEAPSTIITYNKRHFKSKPLFRQRMQVRTPVETVRQLV